MHDLDMAEKVSAISKVVMASSAEVWLINCPGPTFNHFYSNDMEGLNPGIVIQRPASGNYNIWIGTVDRGAAQPATLRISEMPPSRRK